MHILKLRKAVSNPIEACSYCTLVFLFVGVLTSWLGLWLCFKFEVYELVEDVPFNKELRVFLLKRLVKVSRSRPCNPHESSSESNGVLYVMGGDQESLKHRFKTAAELYHRGRGKKILILSEPGITEYDPVIQRNLTNDEWAIKQLVGFGVGKEDIEPVSLEEEFLGTFAEAKGVLGVAVKSDYKHLILVSSPSHTMRVWATFSKCLHNHRIRLHIYASNDHVNLRSLLLEYFKLVIYENVVLPTYASPG